MGKISDYLNDKHFKHSHSGYDYVEMAIDIGLEDKQLVCRQLTTAIYPRIATAFAANVPCVERNIRHAIQKSDAKGTTNAEFIARAVDHIKGE